MSRANNIEKTKSIISNERESFETCQTSQILGNDTIDSQQKQCSEADNLWVTVSWKLKTIALFSIMMLSTGSMYAEGMIPAMKSTMIINLKIDNTRYGILAAADLLVNTIMPIVGGFLIDLYNPAYGTLVVNICVLIGSVLTVVGLHLESFAITLAGRAVFGLGSGQIITMQWSLLARWFSKQHLSTMIGLSFALHKLTTFLGVVASGAVARYTGDSISSFWLSAVMCAFSVIMNIVYALVHRHLSNSGATNYQDTKCETVKNFHWRALARLRIFYWYTILLNFIFAGVWISFRSVSTNLVQVQFGASQDKAAYIASVGLTVPIILTPVVGKVLDQYGKRLSILTISSMFLILSCALLGWTHINPLVGMALYSIASALGPLCIVTAASVLMPSEYVGIALGLSRSSMGLGATAMNILVGVVQDHTPSKSYAGVMILDISVACFGLLLTAGIWWHQRICLGDLLESGRKETHQRLNDYKDEQLILIRGGQNPYSRTRTGIMNYVYLGIYITVLMATWALFFHFAIERPRI